MDALSAVDKKAFTEALALEDIDADKYVERSRLRQSIRRRPTDHIAPIGQVDLSGGVTVSAEAAPSRSSKRQGTVQNIGTVKSVAKSSRVPYVPLISPAASTSEYALSSPPASAPASPSLASSKALDDGGDGCAPLIKRRRLTSDDVIHSQRSARDFTTLKPTTGDFDQQASPAPYPTPSSLPSTAEAGRKSSIVMLKVALETPEAPSERCGGLETANTTTRPKSIETSAKSAASFVPLDKGGRTDASAPKTCPKTAKGKTISRKPFESLPHSESHDLSHNRPLKPRAARKITTYEQHAPENSESESERFETVRGVAKRKPPRRSATANGVRCEQKPMPGFDERPEPQAQPLIWADGRQALNETLPWYRAYQSGCYSTNGFAYGFLLDAHCHERDYIDANVLITRAGGGLAKDKGTNMMTRETDQAETSQVKAIKNNIAQRNPVAFITGNHNPKCPTTPPHRYNVMDWFKPTHVWCEKSQGKTMFKYRFEKLQSEKTSWWVTKDMAEKSKLRSFPAPYSQPCHSCHETSERVYTVGWMCLRSGCPRFWKLNDDSEPDEVNLKYDTGFLRQYTPWDNEDEPHSLMPEIPTPESLSFLGDDVSWTAWKGIVCPKCGRCNSREHWRGWVCDSADCDFSYSVPHLVIPARALRDHYHPFSTGCPMSRDRVSPTISVTTKFVGTYRINHYKIADGFVAHITPSKAALEERGGPNDMWEELQSEDFGLQRLELKSNQAQGKVLTQQFGMNYGMPYKFVAATQSKGFNDAPAAIRDARTRLNWASKLLTDGQHTGFNELLALGYFEKQSIDYHDDGEKGLGPTIATLSLGYPATMKIRMKDKHSRGLSKTGHFVEDEPIPGCVKFEARKIAWDELQSIKSRDEQKKRVAALPAELGLSLKGQREGDVLQMHLTHGSIVIMSGAKIQQYYEHCVDPLGKLRYALTCRWIELDSLKPEDVPQYAVQPDDGVYDGRTIIRELPQQPDVEPQYPVAPDDGVNDGHAITRESLQQPVQSKGPESNNIDVLAVALAPLRANSASHQSGQGNNEITLPGFSSLMAAVSQSSPDVAEGSMPLLHPTHHSRPHALATALVNEEDVAMHDAVPLAETAGSVTVTEERDAATATGHIVVTDKIASDGITNEKDLAMPDADLPSENLETVNVTGDREITVEDEDIAEAHDLTADAPTNEEVVASHTQLSLIQGTGPGTGAEDVFAAHEMEDDGVIMNEDVSALPTDVAAKRLLRTEDGEHGKAGVEVVETVGTVQAHEGVQGPQVDRMALHHIIT